MSTASNYVLGQSIQEQERLMLQARILRPHTEKFFRAAGIVPGMRVLDLGSGVGDVALLAADMVGPGGRVLGLDRDAKGLERARQRTVEQGCSSWVSFQTANLDEFSTAEEFDAIVGRYVLLYQKDAAATLRHMMGFLKPGGIVTFHEVDFTGLQSSFPPCEIYDQLVALVPEVFRRVGLPPDFGRRLGPTYLDAGLPFPTIVAEMGVGGGRGSPGYPWLAATVISLVPRLADVGLSLPPGVVADQTLAAKLEEAAVAKGSQLNGSIQFGAWARKPL
jgi:predicted O-methyltransferase YrrM